MNEPFPSREEILRQKIKSGSSYHDMLVEQAKSIDLNKVDFDGSDFKPRQKVVEKQKIFRWTRLFVKEEITDLQVNDKIILKHLPTGESLETIFICYAKKGLERDSNGAIIAFDGEEDKKTLCLMLDIDLLESENVKFIRTLFQNTKWYEFQMMRRDELVFENTRTKKLLEYFDVEF
jgi:hypothetical protein